MLNQHPSVAGKMISLLVILLAVVGFFFISFARTQTTDSQVNEADVNQLLAVTDKALVVKDKALAVTVKPFAQLAYHPLKEAPAYVISLQNSLLSAQITTLVDKILVKVGDQVKQGQLLVALDCDDFIWQEQKLEAEKQALKASYQFTQYQYERSKKLLKTKSVSEESHRSRNADLKKLQAQIQSLQVQIKKSRKTIQRCEIKAPFDGVISERFVNVGEFVAPSSVLLRLINTDELEVEVQVPITVVNQLDYKSLDFVYREEHFPLKLRAVIPSIETRARHQRVRLEFIDKKALPDAFGMVHVLLKTINIPANVLVQRGGQTGIFIIKSDTGGLATKTQSEASRQKQRAAIAVFYPIENALTGRPAAIDLAPQTLIVLQGRHALSDAQQVMIQGEE